ncbi:DUF1345 domain-containing protein [Caulobacter sp. NIBR2454]|uniref:DUF1345 domain-containing protein n=1 Tax=Caulobacter sp. NIBR2454 TaxID=3015996 RepID=UPI0022B6BB80|nr:DUF1345 domain-containing protein [Caulobacter sp. NIBR2454]
MNLAALRPHVRLLIALAVGVVAGLVSPAPTLLLKVLSGWDAAAVAYVGLLWALFLTARESDIRAWAADEDEKPTVIIAIVIAALGASLAAVMFALIDGGRSPHLKAATVLTAAATLAVGWALLQSLFTPHYAHRHFQAEAHKAGRGFGFPGDPPASYLDFAYLSFSVGATYQVSDTSVGSTPLRNLITAHAAAAFIYNTALLALGISILAGLFG